MATQETEFKKKKNKIKQKGSYLNPSALWIRTTRSSWRTILRIEASGWLRQRASFRKKCFVLQTACSPSCCENGENKEDGQRWVARSKPCCS